MPEIKITVQHREGLHARPATQFVTTAQQFHADITVHNGDRAANAKSMLGILTLDVNRGTEIKIVAKGDDAEKALSALEVLIANNFAE